MLRTLICSCPSRAIFQEWARYFLESDPELDGLIYGNAHNGADAIASPWWIHSRIIAVRAQPILPKVQSEWDGWSWVRSRLWSSGFWPWLAWD